MGLPVDFFAHVGLQNIDEFGGSNYFSYLCTRIGNSASFNLILFISWEINYP